MDSAWKADWPGDFDPVRWPDFDRGTLKNEILYHLVFAGGI
jgi:hypothetical protein